MKLDRRSFVFGSTATAIVAGANDAFAQIALPQEGFAEISPSQLALVGEEYLRRILAQTPQNEFLFIDKQTFAPVMRFLGRTTNPYLSSGATAAQQRNFDRQLWRMIDRELADRPRLREYLRGFANTTEVIVFCMEQHMCAMQGMYHHMRKPTHTPLMTILNVPGADFNHQAVLTSATGLRRGQQDFMFPGTSRDWARKVITHEIGHSLEGGSINGGASRLETCEERLGALSFERIADRFDRRNFFAEDPANTETINYTWKLVRALSLNRDLDTNIYSEGGILTLHATALELLHGDESITNVQMLGANAAASSMIRYAYGVLDHNGLFGPHAPIPLPDFRRPGHFIFTTPDTIMIPPPPVPINPDDPRETIAHSREDTIPRSVFAAIAEALLERNAFGEMTLARDAAALYVEAVRHFKPDMVDTLDYNTIKTQVLALPQQTIEAVAAYVREASRAENFCRVEVAPSLAHK